MKQIFVDAYLAFNLGDDLFIDILSKRYPNTNFELNYLGKAYRNFVCKYGNLKTRKYNIIDKILEKVNLKETVYNYKEIASRNDALLFIGGAIFREEEYHNTLYNYRIKLIKAFKELKKPVFILGANFGPVETEQFILDYKYLFKYCDDVCFRDEYSYNIFKDMSNVRKESDIVFQLKLKEIQKNKNKEIIGISIIDVNHKQGLADYEDIYIKEMIRIIKYIIYSNKRCSLISFCESEGDLNTINKIINKLDEIEKKNIIIYNYNGNIDEILKVISEFNLFISARFHGNIIAQLMNIPNIPIIYSEKTSNMLKDIGFKGKTVNVKDMDKANIVELLKSNNYSSNVDLENIIKSSEKQFIKLDRFLLE